MAGKGRRAEASSPSVRPRRATKSLAKARGTETASGILESLLKELAKPFSLSPLILEVLNILTADFRGKVDDWKRGRIEIDGSEYAAVLEMIYTHAEQSVFSACAERYIPAWDDYLGERLLAAHKQSKALQEHGNVTRVFIFENFASLTSSQTAMRVMTDQRKAGITVRVLLKDRARHVKFKPDEEDFTLVDGGEALGVTTFFAQSGTGLYAATWHFGSAKAKRFAIVRMNCLAGSTDLTEIEDEIGRGDSHR